MGDCQYVYLLGNGQCDDKANTQDCLFDMDDCCGFSINEGDCEECECKDPGKVIQQLLCNYSVSHKKQTIYLIDPCQKDLMNDGECHEENNFEECNFDGGDCKKCEKWW